MELLRAQREEPGTEAIHDIVQVENLREKEVINTNQHCIHVCTCMAIDLQVCVECDDSANEVFTQCEV